jgi:OFA family oxalate/formate antiporter-like MFS transporter
MASNTKGITVVIACCVAIFMPGALIFAFPGIMGSYWQNAYQVGKADVGLILFYVLAAAGIHMFIVGRLQERIKPARLCVIGALIYGLATEFIGHAEAIRGVYVWAFMVGAGSTFIYLPAITVVQRWYPTWRGLVSGLVSMFFGISGAVAAPIFNKMLLTYHYATTTRILALTTLGVGLLAAIFIKLPKASPTKTQVQHPSVSINTAALTLGQSLRTRSFWLMWFTYAFAGAAGVAMVTLAVPFGLAQGLNAGDAIIMLMAFNLTNGFSRLASGYLSDLTGRKTIMSATFLLGGCAYLILPFLDGIILWGLLATIIGFAFGTLFAVSAPFVSDCFGMEHFGSIFGLIFTAYGFLAGILGPWMGGYILDLSQGNFMPVFCYLGSLLLASALMIWLTASHTECTL